MKESIKRERNDCWVINMNAAIHAKCENCYNTTMMGKMQRKNACSYDSRSNNDRIELTERPADNEPLELLFSLFVQAPRFDAGGTGAVDARVCGGPRGLLVRSETRGSVLPFAGDVNPTLVIGGAVVLRMGVNPLRRLFFARGVPRPFRSRSSSGAARFLPNVDSVGIGSWNTILGCGLGCSGVWARRKTVGGLRSGVLERDDEAIRARERGVPGELPTNVIAEETSSGIDCKLPEDRRSEGGAKLENEATGAIAGAGSGVDLCCGAEVLGVLAIVSFAAVSFVWSP